MKSSKQKVSTEQRLKLFNKICMTTKNDIIDTLECIITENEHLMEKGDKNHSASFYKKYVSQIKNFHNYLLKRELLNLSDFWCYFLSVTLERISLGIIYNPDFNIETKNILSSKDGYHLLTWEFNKLTIKEYAQLNNTTEINVRQWIRRGKIKEAKRYGNIWLIPELAEYKKNGYRYASYEIEPKAIFPAEYEYLNKYNKVLITQDENQTNMFHIEYQKENKDKDSKERYETVKEEIIDTKEKEKLELVLISNPNAFFSNSWMMGYFSHQKNAKI